MRLLHACAALALVGASAAANPGGDKSSSWIRIQQLPAGGGLAQPGSPAQAAGKEKWIEIQGWDWEVEAEAAHGTGELAAIEPCAARKDMVLKGKTIGENSAAPPSRGSVRVALKSPWAGCRVGTRLPSIELRGRGRTYLLRGVSVASCGSARPLEEVSFNYQEIKFQY